MRTIAALRDASAKTDLEQGEMMRRLLLAFALGAALAAGCCATALADTGDATLTPDVPTAETKAESAAFSDWVTGGGPTRVDAPYGYLSTTYCPQQRAYWCGPAAVQTALTNFGIRSSQSTIAARLGTTGGGTSMSVVDDVLRLYTGRPYVYHGATSSTDFYNHVLYSICSKGRPVVVDVRIVAPWGPYRKDHAGHIITMDAVDWRSSTVRMNDSFNEASWISGGGPTGGETTYARSVMWTGVYRHAGHPIVY